MLRITHTTPRRLLSHLRKLTREGEALLASPPFLTPVEEVRWDARVWKCFDRIAHPQTFDGALELDRAEVGPVDLLDFDRTPRSVQEIDELIRRRISRRLVTLMSVVEKVEAQAEVPPPPPDPLT